MKVMTNLPRSAFDSLSPLVQKWIWQQKWQRLRDVQEKAIPAVLNGGDVVISARTAAGKTEAAMLPLLTRVLAKDNWDGFAVLYVSPLKALINDQYRRLESLCEACDIQLHKWHGDVSADTKSKARKRPSGIVLITPESLEALLVRRGREIRFLFASLDAVVIDELHAFIGSERGMQLQSILTRIEVACGRDRIDRIGLSATLGDMQLAAEALRPSQGAQVVRIEGDDEGSGVRLQVRGYYSREPKPGTVAIDGDDELTGYDRDGDEAEIHGIPDRLATDIFRFLRGRRNLIFGGSRQRVELFADRLRRMCEGQRVPNEFFPHHGSLSKEEREDVELRLRDDPRPTTAVATTTLELGIDIGDVESVAQIGPGFSVSSLRQRLGRSGRRAGSPAIIRIFVIEPPPSRGGHPLDRLNLGLIQSIAMVECLKAGWCEPPSPTGLHLSTLLHQVLALVVQTGGVQPATAWKVLCERGPFKTVDRPLFVDLLKCMGSEENKLIEQSPDGLLMIGANGEKITESYEFYPVFVTPREYRILNDNRVLGTYPLDSGLKAGEALIFSGRRWRVITVDDAARIINVKAAKGGKPPKFGGTGGAIHDRVVQEMRSVLSGDERFPYIDSFAQEMLNDARVTYNELGLGSSSTIEFGDGVIVLPWVGTKKLKTLSLALQSANFQMTEVNHAIELTACTADGVRTHLRDLAAGKVPSMATLMSGVSQPHVAKFDSFLTLDLMTALTITERLEYEALPEIAANMVL